MQVFWVGHDCMCLEWDIMQVFWVAHDCKCLERDTICRCLEWDIMQESCACCTGVLSGYVDVDVHDKLWAEVHIGLINLKADVLLIEACYRGRLSYNMNLVKVTDHFTGCPLCRI